MYICIHVYIYICIFIYVYPEMEKQALNLQPESQTPKPHVAHPPPSEETGLLMNVAHNQAKLQ